MGSDRKLAAALPPPPPAPPPTVNGSNNAFPRARPMHGRMSGPTRRSTRGQWTPEEDEILRAAVQRFKGKNWKKIAECFKDRTDVQCLHRWQKVLNPDLIKGPWSKEEDEIIVQLVKKYGPKKWSTISQHLPGRIGKQCRERWHNHLNPGIKREAWTQEEELVLIRAHELHGNKWAELTKYLPGRTDNSIKNHWNSSVKKKIDSYKASGLLEQFQAVPLIIHQTQFQSSGDSSFFRDGIEGEEISECSQVGCSQTPSDMSNAGNFREDFIMSEESDQGKLQSTSPTPPCSEQYYTALDDMTFTIPDIPCEFTCSSSYLDENFSKDAGSSARDCNFGAISLPLNSSSDLAEDSCLPGNYFVAATNHNSLPGHDVVTSVDNCGNDINCGDANVQRCPEMIDLEKYGDFMSFQSLLQFSETDGTTTLQPYNHLSAFVIEGSNSDNITSIPSDVSGQNGLIMSNNKPGQINDSLPALHWQKFVSCTEEGYTKQIDLLESSELVPVNKYISETSDDQHKTPPRAKQPVFSTCENEVGNLCYEPPRFPSLEIPFFSCDLAQSGADARQDFSPLGIRQLMMSASGLTPFKLWDSPSSDDSPDAVLKSAAKTFACTPSILKKRHRDLLSPLSPFSERRSNKKTGNDVNQGFLFTSRLTKEFSRLDVLSNGAVQCKETAFMSDNSKEHLNSSIEDKENVCPAAVRGLTEEANHNHEFEATTPKKDVHKNHLDNLEKGKATSYEEYASETPGVLVERRENDAEFFSPDGIRTSVRPSEVDSSKYTAKEAAISGSPIGTTRFFQSPQPLDHMKRNNGAEASSSGQPVAAATTVTVDSLVNEVGAENLNFFGGTPFRRSMESPSGWKSPWYFSSLVSCPRFEPDITIEDIGIFMSPGENRSFDAIGLMKQINDQGADTYADAREVLGNETPESILRQTCSKKLNLGGDSSNVKDSLLKSRLHMTPKVMTERRVLDFSECGTPGRRWRR
ncbi:hypothetical protein RND81_10G160700 [Saponaria officinalis]|uniref:Uncharacterized protein n=1 Tax=Saponaria officinalis TaxID=3572 RepID=A0AAW1I3Y8_SAPOF